VSWILFAAWSGLLLAALLQLKGWNYHLYPARAACLLFFTALGVGVFQELPPLAAMIRGGGGARCGCAGRTHALERPVLVESRLTVESDW